MLLLAALPLRWLVVPTIWTEQSVSNARLGRTTASLFSPYDPLSTLSRPSLLLPIHSCEVAVVRDCISTGQVPFPLPSPLPWSLFCPPFLPCWSPLLPQVHQSRVQSRACRSWLAFGSTTLSSYDVAFSSLRGIVQFFGASFAAILPPPPHPRLPGDRLSYFLYYLKLDTPLYQPHIALVSP